MTIHRITAGDGYTYLTRQVAGGDVPRERSQDAAEYYTAQGNPPGYWTGRGAALLGVDGQTVTEEQMKLLFGLGMHPDADAMIGAYISEHVTARTSPEQREKIAEAAMRHATLGRAFPIYAEREPFDDRVASRLAAIAEATGTTATPAETARVRREEARAPRAAVAGWDVVFAPVKSAALAWALDERGWVRDAVRQAHMEAMGSALAMLDEHAAFTRAGAGGAAQIGTHGLTYAVFEHHDSRDGDPNLHTHVAVSTKVMGADGTWRSLDARSLHAITVAASEHYNTMFEAAAGRLLGVSFTTRPDTATAREPVREITGIPAQYVEFFSSRRVAIEARYSELVTAYRAEHSRDPSRATCHKLARQANLDTRDQKKEPRSLEAKRAVWRQQLTARFGPDAVAQVMNAVPGPAAQRAPSPAPDVAVVARQVLDNVAVQRSTWTIWNLRAEAERAARYLAAPPGWARQVTELAASPGYSIVITAPAILDEPAVLRRPGGEPVFSQHGATRYTSQRVLDAEQRLTGAAKTLTASVIDGTAVTAALARFEAATGTVLDAGQRHLVMHFATSGALIAAGIGPAGTGKTTAMRAYQHVLREAGHRVIPLAPSAAAARVLGDSLEVKADTVDKFLYEHVRGRYAKPLAAGQPVPDRLAVFALRPGDVVLVDEASMTATLKLDQVTAIAARHGAVVRPLGDHAQLGAVEGGGALRLIAAEAGAAELTAVYRFADPAEAAATLAIRTGDNAGLDFYFGRDRVRSGSRQAMTQAAYDGWKKDMLAGKLTLMAAAAGVDVTALSARARADRVSAGQVEPGGITLADGNLAGRGDWILTRRNDRRLTLCAGRDWVKNGDGWTVTARHGDGSLTVSGHGHGRTITLPSGYVERYVQLLYATTTHRTQGATVDTAHPLISPGMTRENLYTIISRARHATTLYVVTHDLTPFDIDPQTDLARHEPYLIEAREILETITSRDTSQRSATETIRDEQQHAASLATLVPRYLHAVNMLTRTSYDEAIRVVLGPAIGGTIVADPASAAVRRALQHAETAGWQPARILAAAAGSGPLGHADNPATLLAARIKDITAACPAPAHLHQPDPADIRRYATLLNLINGTVPSPDDTQQPPVCLTAPSASPPRVTHLHVTPGTLDRYAADAAGVLGTSSHEVISHRAWPRLAGILTAAGHDGHDTTALLAQASAAATDVHDPVAALTRTAERLATAHGAEPVSVSTWRHLADLAAVTGIETAEQARQEYTWPALTAALRRAEHAGYDPRALLTQAAAAPGMTSADRPSEFLARHISHQLAGDPAIGTDLWPQLAWTLKAAETYGTTAETVLIRSGPSPDQHAILRQAQQAARPPREEPPLPWLPAVPAGTADPVQRDLASYVAQAAQAISDRARYLAAATAEDPSMWMLPLGEPQRDHQHEAAWLGHLAIIVAYRDQQQVSIDDPGQILGPYAGPGHPGHDAYWHAAAAIHHACQASGILAPPPPGADLATRADDQIAIDTYNALPEPDRLAIAQQIATQLGYRWYGDPHHPDADAVTQPACTTHLADALAIRGYLSSPPVQPQPEQGSTTSVAAPIETIRHQHRQHAPRPVLIQPPPEPIPSPDILPDW
jgi:conjugative relaxase-like TrwC/TraI family protein